MRLKNEPAKALEDLDKSMSYTVYKPGPSSSSFGLGPTAVNYYIRGRKSLVSLNDTSYPYEERGLDLSMLDRTEEAIVALTKAIDLGSTDGWIYAVRGKERIKAGQFADGISDTDTGLRLGVPKEVEYFVFHNRAIANLKLGNDISAAADAKKSLAAPIPGLIASGAPTSTGFRSWQTSDLARVMPRAMPFRPRWRSSPPMLKNSTVASLWSSTRPARAVDVCPDYWIAYDGRKSTSTIAGSRVDPRLIGGSSLVNRPSCLIRANDSGPRSSRPGWKTPGAPSTAAHSRGRSPAATTRRGSKSRITCFPDGKRDS